MTATIIETTGKTPSWPTCYKRTSGGRVQSWNVVVEPGDDGTADVVTTYGLVDGKQNVQRETIREGKNAGRKNATTPTQQAVLEAEASFRKQLERRHYGLDPEANESASKRAVAPMLAHKYADHARKVDWSNAYAQAKYDGHRMLGFVDKSGVRLVSRKGVAITTLPHIAEALARLAGDTPHVYDGEVYLHGATVTDIGGWIKRARPETELLQYHVYDLAENALGLGPGFHDRWRSIAGKLDGLAPGGPLRRVETRRVKSEQELFAFRDECLAGGYEGAMLRWGDAGYEAGERSAHLLKLKSINDDEFEVVGFREGRGTNACMAIFRCVTAAGAEFEVTAPGTHEEKREHFLLGASRVGKQLTVKYAYFTKTAKPVPFHPVAVGFRVDV